MIWRNSEGSWVDVRWDRIWFFSLSDDVDSVKEVVNTKGSEYRLSVVCGCEESSVLEMNQFGGKIILHRYFYYMAQSLIIPLIIQSKLDKMIKARSNVTDQEDPADQQKQP